MKISKSVVLDGGIKIAIAASHSNYLKLTLFIKGNRLFARYLINSKVIDLPEGNSFVLMKQPNYNGCLLLIKVVKDLITKLVYEKYRSFAKVYMIGLGYKNFVLGNTLYILVGDCNYIIYKIPESVKVYCKKNQIYMLGQQAAELFNFMSEIKRIKKPNFYKGKGILQFKNFKFTKLKVGKKQRFM